MNRIERRIACLARKQALVDGWLANLSEAIDAKGSVTVGNCFDVVRKIAAQQAKDKPQMADEIRAAFIEFRDLASIIFKAAIESQESEKQKGETA